MGTETTTVTLLFCDLVESTRIISELGDDAADGLRHRLFEALREVVVATRGSEVKTLGDGLMVAFPSATDAVACAVGMQRAADRIDRRTPDVQVRLRVGLSAGEATLENDDWFGTPVVEASRLCGAASPGQILAADIIRMLVGSRGGHIFHTVGPLELKGLPGPLDASEASWEPEPVTEIPLPAGLDQDAQFAFVGRVYERERLRTTWEAIPDDGHGLILVSGEPGIGKTRLVVEFAREVHRSGAVVLAGRCDEDLQVPYQPFVEGLRHLLLYAPVEEMIEEVGPQAAELARLLPEITANLDGPPPAEIADPDVARHRLFEAVTTWLGAAARRQPVAFLLDDLQWAARPTLLLLRHLLRSTRPLRLLMIGTYRDTDIGRTDALGQMLADLRREPNVERVALAGLDVADVASFLKLRAGHPLDDRGLELVRVVHRETQGNPFFIGEVLRHLAETGAIYLEGGRWTSDFDPEEIGIPEGIREVVGRRLSRLPDETNQVLGWAAVIGQEFEVPLLERVADLDGERLLDALDAAARARLLDEVPDDFGRYRFAHALVRSILYDELSIVRRTRRHQRIAEALEDLYGDRVDAVVGDLAHHYGAAALAGDAAKAVEYALRAGDRALEQFADEEAQSHFRRGLELLDDERDHSAYCDLLIGFGRCQRRLGDPAFRATLLEAAQLARAAGDANRLADAALANTRGIWSNAGEVDHERVEVLQAAIDALGDRDPARRARLLASLASEITWFGERSRRVAMADEALSIAQEHGDPVTLMTVLLDWHAATNTAEMLPRHLETTRQLLDLIDHQRDPLLSVTALQWRFIVTFLAARLDESREMLGEIGRLLDELDHPFLRWWYQVDLASLAMVEGEVARAEQLATDAFQRGEEAGEPDAFTWYAAQIFGVRWFQGRVDELVPIIEAEIERHPALTSWSGGLGLGYLESGRVDDAQRLFDRQAATAFDLPRDVNWLAGVLPFADLAYRLDRVEAVERLYALLQPSRAQHLAHLLLPNGTVEDHLGRLALTAGDLTLAERHFQRADVVYDRIGHPFARGRMRAAWADLLLRRRETDDVARAEELLADVEQTGQDLGMPPLVGAAERVARLH